MTAPDLPPGIIDARVVAMTDADGNLTTDPDKAARIEVEQVSADGLVEHIIMEPDQQ